VVTGAAAGMAAAMRLVRRFAARSPEIVGHPVALLNRDTRAIQLKLDEILRASEGARNELVKLEQLPDPELAQIEQEILELREQE